MHIWRVSLHTFGLKQSGFLLRRFSTADWRASTAAEVFWHPQHLQELLHMSWKRKHGYVAPKVRKKNQGTRKIKTNFTPLAKQAQYNFKHLVCLHPHTDLPKLRSSSLLRFYFFTWNGKKERSRYARSVFFFPLLTNSVGKRCIDPGII